jgi:transcriptional regulator with PAS, ATPase and Fis domain
MNLNNSIKIDYNQQTILHFEAKMEFDWAKQIEAAVTVCDTKGIILYMNDKSILGFSNDGGSDLIGKNLLDCHPEPARSKLVTLLKDPKVNAYTIEKKGIRKLIYQAPWYSDGVFSGFVEISCPLPEVLPHFIRK